ncbi:MAG TPA: hypothetical protein VE569_09710, partial [Acidimicrobiia bacterium]|nr:hypothetical protein [Acidimicrobiia bacterium]
VVNRPGKGVFKKAETVSELVATFDYLPVVTLPFDRKLADAIWDGELTTGRTYERAVAAMADVIVRSLS